MDLWTNIAILGIGGVSGWLIAIGFGKLRRKAGLRRFLNALPDAENDTVVENASWELQRAQKRSQELEATLSEEQTNLRYAKSDLQAAQLELANFTGELTRLKAQNAEQEKALDELTVTVCRQKSEVTPQNNADDIIPSMPSAEVRQMEQTIKEQAQVIQYLHTELEKVFRDQIPVSITEEPSSLQLQMQKLQMQLDDVEALRSVDNAQLADEGEQTDEEAQDSLRLEVSEKGDLERRANELDTMLSQQRIVIEKLEVENSQLDKMRSNLMKAKTTIRQLRLMVQTAKKERDVAFHLTRRVRKQSHLASVSPSEDLRQIPGIGTAAKQALLRMGVNRVSQIAQWGRHDLEKWSSSLGAFAGSEDIEGWIATAKALAMPGFDLDVEITDVAEIPKPPIDNLSQN